MEGIKVNFYNKGKRTSAIIPEHIYLTWADAIENPPQSREELSSLMAQRIEEGFKEKHKTYSTQQKIIESFLMEDVRKKLWLIKF